MSFTLFCTGSYYTIVNKGLYNCKKQYKQKSGWAAAPSQLQSLCECWLVIGGGESDWWMAPVNFLQSNKSEAMWKMQKKR